MKNFKIVFNKQIKNAPKEKDIYIAAQVLLEKKFSQLFLSTTILEVGVNYISSAKIKTLNSRYRHIDKSTDVLSFPIYKNIKQIQASPNLTNNLGDIFVCLPEAKKNAQEKNISLDEEIIFLIVHGLKHLLGFHHR